MSASGAPDDAQAQVYLVGAGPGDPELLTLKAVRAIARASVILIDDLVNPAVLAHADPRARVVHVGKRGGCQSTPQASIDARMLAEARAGETVVRLKGGDPFIFGRGGEEVQTLQAAGLSVCVINGVTAGLAAATGLGVPLTHRARAHGVVFVTGHPQAGGAGADWPALAQAAHAAHLTLVVYMGMRGLPELQQGLLQHLPGSTPAAVVQHASLPQQRQVLTTLAELAQTASRLQLGSPSVLIIGDVLLGSAQWRELAPSGLPAP